MSMFYFISPLDILPEAIFGIFGYVDDCLVVLMALIYACQTFRNVIANRNIIN